MEKIARIVFIVATFGTLFTAVANATGLIHIMN